MAQHPTCRSCSKWKQPNLSSTTVDLHNPPQGECHDRAPTVLAAFLPGRTQGEVAVKPFVLWPHTGHNDWCAQHPDFAIQKGDSEEKAFRETYGRNNSSPLVGD